MADPVKLTKAEALALVAELENAAGYDALAFALVGAIGADRAGKLVADKEGRISKSETVALIKAVLPLVPGYTLKAKIKFAISALRRAIPDKTRQDAILAYVVERIQAYKAGPAASAAPATWDACTRASCWDGANAQKRMMNILSPNFSQEKYVQYRQWMLSLGCNTAHVFLSNRRDGEGAGYSIYSGEWSWEIEAATAKLMRDRMADLRAHGLAVIPWLFADDSAAWNSAAAKDFPRYLADLKAQGLLENAPTVVAGLELDEYYQSAQVSALVNSIRKVYSGKIGTHEASGYKFAALGDIVFLQTETGRTPAQIKAAVAAACKNTGKPVNCFEIERHPAGTEQIEAAFAGGAFAVGNWNGKASLHAPANVTDSANDVNLSAAKWLGRIDGRNAKVGASIDPLTFDGKAFRYKQSPETAAWKPRFTNNGRSNSAACFFVKRDGVWTGGRFDDCSETRNSRDRKNIDGGYLGIKPKVGEEVRFCLINKTGTVRSNAPGVIWK